MHICEFSGFSLQCGTAIILGGGIGGCVSEYLVPDCSSKIVVPIFGREMQSDAVRLILGTGCRIKQMRQKILFWKTVGVSPPTI